MKKIFTFLCAAVIAASTVNAEVLFSESFDSRPTGDLKSGDYSNFEANGNWYNSLGSTYIQVAEQQLTYAGYCSSVTGKTSKFSANHGKDFVGFSKSANSGTVYSSFLIKVNSLKTSSGAKGTSNLIVAMWSNFSSNAAGYMFSQVKIKSIDSDTYNLGIAKRTETAQFADDVLEVGKTYLVVAEYIFQEDVDAANLYINPTKENPSISKSANLAPTGAQTDATQIVGAVLASNGNTPDDMLIDELKVTTSWDDLWEGDEPQPETPTIIADQSFAFGNVNVNEAANKDLTIKGSNLKGAISIASNNEQVVVSAASVTKEAAESSEGASISVTLTATAAGEGSAKITLSSQDAEDKVINVSWNAIAPMPSAENIAAIASLTEGEPSVLATQPIVVGSIEGIWVLQDATGAFIYNEYGMCELAIGDKLTNVTIIRPAEEEYTRGFITAYAYDFPTKVSSGNAISPIATNIANMIDLGPAIIKLTEVEFTDLDKNEFAKGWFNIKQGENTARIQVPENCDIIGEAIPAKADVVGQLIFTTGGIAINASADIANRTARGTTAVENTADGKSTVKVVRNGQIVILRDGKAFNILGAEMEK